MRAAAHAPESVVCLAGLLGGRTFEDGWTVLVDGLQRVEATAAGVGVHVSDWPSHGRSDRVLPGQGVTPTREAVQALTAAGQCGSLDVEIFSTPDGFWALPVEEAARRARAALWALGQCPPPATP